MNGASLPIGSSSSTGCPCAAFLAIQIPQRGLDPPQPASNRLPAADQFPPSVPAPPLSNFHASSLTFAICFWSGPSPGAAFFWDDCSASTRNKGFGLVRERPSHPRFLRNSGSNGFRSPETVFAFDLPTGQLLATGLGQVTSRSSIPKLAPRPHRIHCALVQMDYTKGYLGFPWLCSLTQPLLICRCGRIREDREGSGGVGWGLSLGIQFCGDSTTGRVQVR